MAYFFLAAVQQHVDPYGTWRAGGGLFAYMRDVVVSWLITMGLLLCLGMASGMSNHYRRDVMLAWLAATPLAMLASALAMRRFGLSSGAAAGVRSVVIIGANDVSVRFAANIARNPHLPAAVHGYFDDRTAERPLECHPHRHRRPGLVECRQPEHGLVVWGVHRRHVLVGHVRGRPV